MKKSILIFLTGLLLIGLFVGTASAALAGSGTQSDPWQINSSADLVLLSGTGYASYIGNDKYFVLNTDISSPSGFNSIGTSAYRFNGHIDGQNHTITLSVPLLGYCENGHIELKRISFYNSNISGFLINKSGNISGDLNFITIDSCTMQGIYPNTSYLVNMSNITIKNSYATNPAGFFPAGGTDARINVNNVIMDNDTGSTMFFPNVNGSCEIKNVTINNCSLSTGQVYVGGIFNGVAALDNGERILLENITVTNCTSYGTGQFGTTAYLSGFIAQGGGNVIVKNCHLKNCIFKATSTTGHNIYGFFNNSQTSSSMTPTIENCSIENCNFTPTTREKYDFSNKATVINSTVNDLTYDDVSSFRILPTASLTNDSPQSNPKNVNETVTLTLNGTQGSYGRNISFAYGDGGSQVGDNKFTVSYVTTGIKNISLNFSGGYTLTSTAYIDIPEKLNGSGTQSDPYQVTSDEDLHSWSNYDFFYDTAYMAILQDFTPTTTVMEFNGHLNGNNHTLSNGKQPLFNKLGGTVQNLNFSDAIVNGNGLLATKSSAAVSNVNADNCFVGGSTAGGLVGTATGSFTDCTVNHITVKGTKSAGGITADGDTTVDSCHVLNSDLLAPITYGMCADTDHFTPKKYTIVWDESSSTSKNITYADDAAGMSENDRNELIKDHTHFAVVQWNGTEPEVNYYLYRDNLDYKATDESCDVSSGEPSVLTGADGDVMVLYDTVWWTTSKVGNSWYMTFTWDMELTDDTWVSPHTYGDNLQTTSLAKYVGLGVFEGYIQNSQLRSINTSQTPTGNITQNNFYVSATTGRNWQYNNQLPMTYAWYIMQLYFVKGNRDVQTAYGNGIVGSSPSAINKDWSTTNSWNNGTTTNQTTGVTALGIQNAWGNVYEFMGETRYDNKIYRFSILGGKDHYNIESGYASTWKSITVANTIEGYNITQITGTPEYPFFPNAGSGSTWSQNYGDYGYQTTSTACCVHVAGNSYDGLIAGALAVYANNTVSVTNSTIGARLHVVIT